MLACKFGKNLPKWDADKRISDKKFNPPNLKNGVKVTKT